MSYDKERIQKFWDKLGHLEIKQFPSTHPLLGSTEVMIDAYVWKPTGQRLGHQIGVSTFPPITLDNLFKYAVPPAIDKIMKEQECSSDLAYAILFKKWLQELELMMSDPTTALFLAIEKVMNE